MGVGVHQHICRSVSSGSLNGLHIAAGDHQLIRSHWNAANRETQCGELRVGILPFEELLRISTGSTARPLGRRNSIPLSW